MPGTFNNLPIDAFEMENHRPISSRFIIKINLILINAVLSSNLRFKINNLIVFNDMILVFYFYL